MAGGSTLRKTDSGDPPPSRLLLVTAEVRKTRVVENKLDVRKVTDKTLGHRHLRNVNLEIKSCGAVDFAELGKRRAPVGIL